MSPRAKTWFIGVVAAATWPVWGTWIVLVLLWDIARMLVIEAPIEVGKTVQTHMKWRRK